MTENAQPSGRFAAFARRHESLFRYGLAIMGPLGVAGSQFLVSLTMIHLVSPREFGSFSFLMVGNVLSWGICSALVCAPMPVLLYQRSRKEGEHGEAMLVAASACFALLSMLVLGIAALAIDTPPMRALLFAGYAWASVSRYFARSHALARHRQIVATVSDALFAAVLLLAIGIALLRPAEGGTIVYAGLLASALAGLLPFGSRYVLGQLVRIRLDRLRGYRAIWRTMSSWSVLGVVTTEASNNAHAYLITSFLGPAAFAPLAASMLVTRPVAVIATALGDFERPRLARYIGEGRYGAMRRSLRHFGLAIAASWFLTALAAGALFLLGPRLIFSTRYDIGYMALGASLWMAVSAARLAALPPSCLLIARGSFRLLAYTSLWSGLLAIAIVALMMTWFDSMFSILGILAGQSLYAVLIQRRAARWLAAQTEGEAPAG